MRRAKIVCTLGPATSTPEAIRALVDAGMDVARLNLSHGSYADHEEIYRIGAARVRRDRARRRDPRRPAGPEDPARHVRRRPGAADTRRSSSRSPPTTCPAPTRRCSTTYAGLPGDVGPGDRILIDDGKVALSRSSRSTGPRVVTRVVEGGMVSDHKGINLPGVAVSVPAMSEKDVEDLRWGLRLGVDMIALSFVRSRRRRRWTCTRIMDEEGIRLPVIAKIEKPQAVEHLEEIVEAFDGIMVARGDLGVELPLRGRAAGAEARGHAGPRPLPSRSSSRPRCSSR